MDPAAGAPPVGEGQAAALLHLLYQRPETVNNTNKDNQWYSLFVARDFAPCPI